MSAVYEGLPFDPNDASLETPGAAQIRAAYRIIIVKIFGAAMGVYALEDYQITPQVMQATDKQWNSLVLCSKTVGAIQGYLKAAIVPVSGTAALGMSIKNLWRLHRYGYSSDTLETAIQQWCDVMTSPEYSPTCLNVIVRAGAMAIYPYIPWDY